MTGINSQELQYWIAFNQLPEFGPKRFAKLLNYFPDLKTAWQTSDGELLRAGIEENIAGKLADAKKKINPEQELEKITNQAITVITIKDDTYPASLKEIHNPPPLLYCQGEIFMARDRFALAVVGTRKISPYGQQATADIVRELTLNNLVIVSGLALGIDALAHKTCVEAGGRTIAVLGNGIDSIYPASNLPLAKRILDCGGLIISEFPLGTPSFKSNFPHRNRIISGLSLGTLVIEAGVKSGSLITAQLTLEQNREVFALPGSIYSQGSKGPNQLIKQGATPVTQTQDILQALNLQQITEAVTANTLLPATDEEKQIIELLQLSARTIDQLIKHTGLDAKKINSILVGMELKGLIRNSGNQVYPAR